SLENGLKILGTLRSELAPFSGARVGEPETASVQRQPGVDGQDLDDIARSVVSRAPPAIQRVTDNRVADEAQMHPDPVRPPGRRLDFEERHLFERLAYPEGSARAPAVRPHGHPDTGGRMTSDRPVDETIRPIRSTPDQGLVELLHGARL